MDYARARRVSLKSHPEYTEKWLQQQIASDPDLLGLGDIDVKDVERRQPRAGRLDLLLHDPEINTRYEVEIQLGPTDESHIIRTLEYWDNERRRFPQYDHVAVIIAEEITGRFLNVINLFNQAIPLIAIQMSALEVSGVLTLHATRVLDLALPAPEEDDEPGQETDRTYWEHKATKTSVQIADKVLEMINIDGPSYALKYNKHYIGLARDGMADNFVTFRPRRKHIIIEWRIPRSEELDARLDDSGMSMLGYDKRWGRYRAQIDSAKELTTHAELVTDLNRMARGVPLLVSTED